MVARFVVVGRGQGSLTVQAGTFQAQRWDEEMRVERNGAHVTARYTVGITEIRRDYTFEEMSGGTGLGTLELVRGPVR